MYSREIQFDNRWSEDRPDGFLLAESVRCKRPKNRRCLLQPSELRKVEPRSLRWVCVANKPSDRSQLRQPFDRAVVGFPTESSGQIVA